MSTTTPNDAVSNDMWPQLHEVVVGNSEDDDVPWHDLMDAEEPMWDDIDPPVPIPCTDCSGSGMDAMYPTKKRESLDATESWLSEDDDNMMDIDFPSENVNNEITITFCDHDDDEDMMLADHFMNDNVSTSLADWSPAKANTLLNDEHAYSINNSSQINNNSSSSNNSISRSFDDDDDLDDLGKGEDDEAMMHLILNDAASLHELLNSTSSPQSRRPSLSSSVAAVATDHQSLSSSSVSSKSFQDLFEERRAQLAISMQKTRNSRNRCFLQEHVKTRATLAHVLRDIERSSRVVAKHVVQYWEEQRKINAEQTLPSVTEEPKNEDQLSQHSKPIQHKVTTEKNISSIITNTSSTPTPTKTTTTSKISDEVKEDQQANDVTAAASA